MAKLNKTQVNAIIEKLRREFNERPSTGPSEDDMVNANNKHGMSLFKEELSPQLFKVFHERMSDWGIQEMFEDVSTARMKKLSFPYPNQDAIYNLDRGNPKFGDMLRDLEFDLTMAGTDDYKEYMAAFSKKVKKAFG